MFDVCMQGIFSKSLHVYKRQKVAIADALLQEYQRRPLAMHTSGNFGAVFGCESVNSVIVVLSIVRYGISTI